MEACVSKDKFEASNSELKDMFKKVLDANSTVREELVEKDAQHKMEIDALKAMNEKQNEQIVQQNKQIVQQKEQIVQQKEQIVQHKEQFVQQKEHIEQMQEHFNQMNEETYKRHEDLSEQYKSLGQKHEKLEDQVKVLINRVVNLPLEDQDNNQLQELRPVADEPPQQEPRLGPIDALNETCDAFVEFTEDTTIHGLKHMFNPRSSRKKRLWHVAGFILVVVWFGIMANLSVKRYKSYPVSSSIEVIYPDSMEFPSLTICSISPLKKSYYRAYVANGSLYPIYEGWYKGEADFLKQQVRLGNMEVNFTLLDNMTNADVRSLMSGEQWREFKEADHKANEASKQALGHHLHAGGFQYDDVVYYIRTACRGCNYGTGVSSNYTTYIAYHQRAYEHQLTLCHTLKFYNWKNEVLHIDSIDTGIMLYLKFHDHFVDGEGYSVQVHADGEKPEHQLTQWLTVKGDADTHIHVSRQDIHNLPAPYGSSNCACNETLKYVKRYTKEACESECEADHVFNWCGCKENYFSPGPGLKCNETITYSCIYRIENGFLYHAIQYNCSHCLPSCDQQIFSASIIDKEQKTYRENDIAVLYVESDPSYTVITQTPAYPGTSLLGEVGGTLGLCMGASLLTLTEIADLIFKMFTGIGICFNIVKRNFKEAFSHRRYAMQA